MGADPKLGSLADRADLKAKDIAAPSLKRCCRIMPFFDQPPTNRRHRRCCAHSNPERRACVGADAGPPRPAFVCCDDWCGEIHRFEGG
jgi:hypothetical protein